MFSRTRTHPSPTLCSLFHTFSFNVFMYYNCFLLFFSSTSYSLTPLYSHPHPFAVSAHFHSVFFISTLASLLVTLSPPSFLPDFPFSHDFLSHLHQSTEMGITQKQCVCVWGGGHFYITFTLSKGEDVRECNACAITMIWTIFLTRHRR